MSVIYIRDLMLEAKHGILPGEKQHAQRFNVSAEITFDTAKAVASDDLVDTLDWVKLRRVIIDTVQDNSFNLVEKLAAEAAANLLSSDQRIEKVTVSIDKLDAFKTGVPGVRLEAERPANG